MGVGRMIEQLSLLEEVPPKREVVSSNIQPYFSRNGLCSYDGCPEKVKDWHHIAFKMFTDDRGWPLLGLCREHHVALHRFGLGSVNHPTIIKGTNQRECSSQKNGFDLENNNA